MTLSDLADLICVKINQQETEDLDACKSFLKRRFEMIWQSALWKDSLFEYTQTVDDDDYVVTDTWLPSKNTLLLPTQILQVIAVRTDTSKLNAESSEIFYRIDPDTFASTGNPRKYRVLPSVVWELDSVKSCVMYTTQPNIAGVIDYLSNDGVTLVRATSSDLTTQLAFTTERIDNITKGAALLTVADLASTDFLTIAAAVTSVPKRQRVQIFGTVADDTVIRVLGKTRVPTFTADDDEPALTGVDNCLIAFAQADMLQRERQYDRARVVQAEGVALLDQLKHEQTAQQAHHKQLIPEDGYGNLFGDNRFEEDFGAMPNVTINTMGPLRTAGSMNLDSGISAGNISQGMLFTPVRVFMHVRIPPGGTHMEAHVVAGTLSTSGCDFTLTGTTDSANYILDYEFMAAN